jgi:hypothetical protein
VQALGFSFSIHDINPDKPLSDATYREFMTDFLNRYLLS